MKQVIVVRTDLKMGKGKLAAQAAHASLAAFLAASEADRSNWLEQGMKKVVVKLSSEKELLNLYKKIKKERLPCELIIDRGLTQIKGGTVTAAGIGPEEDRKIDKFTKKLKLL